MELWERHAQAISCTTCRYLVHVGNGDPRCALYRQDLVGSTWHEELVDQEQLRPMRRTACEMHEHYRTEVTVEQVRWMKAVAESGLLFNYSTR